MSHWCSGRQLELREQGSVLRVQRVAPQPEDRTMIRRTLTVAALLACAAGVTRASAQRAHFGFHGGYNTDMDRGALGVQMQMPLSQAIAFYPSMDYYLV